MNRSGDAAMPVVAVGATISFSFRPSSAAGIGANLPEGRNRYLCLKSRFRKVSDRLTRQLQADRLTCLDRKRIKCGDEGLRRGESLWQARRGVIGDRFRRAKLAIGKDLKDHRPQQRFVRFEKRDPDRGVQSGLEVFKARRPLPRVAAPGKNHAAALLARLFDQAEQLRRAQAGGHVVMDRNLAEIALQDAGKMRFAGALGPADDEQIFRRQPPGVESLQGAFVGGADDERFARQPRRRARQVENDLFGQRNRRLYCSSGLRSSETLRTPSSGSTKSSALESPRRSDLRNRRPRYFPATAGVARNQRSPVSDQKTMP